MSNSIRVIVIGGGAAGIAAASRLYENGVKDVLVLEAEDRIGGRVYTLDVEGDAGFIEVGAQWVHGEKGNAVFELASPRNLLNVTDISFQKMLFVQSSRQVVDCETSTTISEIFEKVRNEIEDDVREYKTSGDYFLDKINSALGNIDPEIHDDLKRQFIEWFHQFINSIDGTDSWFQSSASTLVEYLECEGYSLVSWKEHGYRSILSILMEKSNSLSNGDFEKCNIIKNTEALKITYDNDKMTVHCDDGKKYDANHVIITVSLGVLKEQFSQLLPACALSDKKKLALENLQIGTVDKLFLKFPYDWWPEEISGFNFLWSDDDRKEYEKLGLKWLTDVFSFLKVDNSPLMLCGWVTGSSARTMESMDQSVVKSQLVQLLKKFLGDRYEIPEPDWFFRSNWQSNKHFRGSYSFRGPACDKLKVSSADLSVPFINHRNIPVILFAGEATHPHYYSTVHGAIETGWREADRILSFMRPTK